MVLILRGGVKVARRSLKAKILVRIQAPQLISYVWLIRSFERTPDQMTGRIQVRHHISVASGSLDELRATSPEFQALWEKYHSTEGRAVVEEA